MTARSPAPTSSCSARSCRPGFPVIAAGGISSIEDLLAVRDLGCEAAVAGSALLAGRFTLAEAAALRVGLSDQRDRDRPDCVRTRLTGERDSTAAWPSGSAVQLID